jgi:hypothetical protein
LTRSLNVLPVFLGVGAELLPASDGAGKAIKSASDMVIIWIPAGVYTIEVIVYRASRANLH